MESFKQLVQAVQMCQSALRVPEEVMPNLAICRTALRLQQEASQLQHVAIQQCNILQVRAARASAASHRRFYVFNVAPTFTRSSKLYL